MAETFLQTERRGRLSTVLGPDVLNLMYLNGTEELSGYFTWVVDALSDQPDIDLNQVLGTHATVEIDVASGQRYFDGIVTEAQWQGMGDNGNRYRLVLRPWLHVAGLRRNQRIFHNLSVDKILTELFADYAHLGAPHLELRLTDDYPELEYTVQYGESDADFATRMMERFGITWAWEHDAGNHTLVLTDYVSNHKDLPGGTRPYYGVQRFHLHEEEHFHEWHGGGRVTTGAVRLTEYNFKIPHAAQEVDLSAGAPYANGDIESFDFPGDYLERDVGETVVSRRIAAEAGQSARVVAKGDLASLAAGLCVTPVGDELPGATGVRFVCLKAEHHFRSQAYGTTAATTDEEAYSGTYVLTPADAPFRPERRTEPARIYGPQTAMVVGEGEIDCDEYGRILVQFHWDLHAAYSMRCRVSQNWASKGWGGMVIPRIGMEVIVEFLNGDPDHPIVTGCVYNGHNMPPYALPNNKTISTFKTDTHLGRGFNEFRFQDENGLEEIFIHAQRDRNEKTRNNHTERIDNNWVQSIGHNKAIEVKNNHVEQIGGNLSLSVGPGGIGQIASRAFTGMTDGISNLGYNLGIPGGVNPGEGNMHIAVEKSKSETIGTVSRNHVGIGYSLTAGKSVEFSSGKTFGVTVGERASETVGNTKTITVGDRFTIICGGSRIVMHASGLIEMIGADLDVQMSNNVSMTAGNNISFQAGRIIEIQSGEKIELSSGVVNIAASAGMTLDSGANLDLTGLVINLN